VLETFQQHVPGLSYEVVTEGEANYQVKGDGPHPLPSNRRAVEELGWRPRTSFADGMRDYLAWIQANGPQ
jgi:nucleoside-diphosphate-sugar epimerase